MTNFLQIIQFIIIIATIVLAIKPEFVFKSHTIAKVLKRSIIIIVGIALMFLLVFIAHITGNGNDSNNPEWVRAHIEQLKNDSIQLASFKDPVPSKFNIPQDMFDQLQEIKSLGTPERYNSSDTTFFNSNEEAKVLCAHNRFVSDSLINTYLPKYRAIYVMMIHPELDADKIKVKGPGTDGIISFYSPIFAKEEDCKSIYNKYSTFLRRFGFNKANFYFSIDPSCVNATMMQSYDIK